ncbi:hypothetical protein GCM10020331_012440 [Ectobacillus funiculus]
MIDYVSEWVNPFIQFFYKKNSLGVQTLGVFLFGYFEISRTVIEIQIRTS